ncbi:MAG: UDP-glucose 4-epimerase GalE [Nitrososphaerales archaeon]|jgi:UDP-glucose 4-epimerase
MKVLIAGGAGYVGSTIASACIDSDIEPIIVDSLTTGRREFTKGRTFYEGDIADQELIARIFDENSELDAAILCAAFVSVPDSISRPLDYYENNVVKCLSFIRALIASDCRKLIFSSSASLYATSELEPVDENSPLEPTNPYARSKTAFEWMLEDISHSGLLRVLSFRYFNPIGADPRMRSGLQSLEPSHALGAMIRAMKTNENFTVTGTDFATRDGTGIRDYVHVWDVAQAHVAALEQFDSILSEVNPYEVINLGSGRGTTVRELVATFNEVSIVPIDTVDMPRRKGDTAGAYANYDKAQRLLGWIPKLSLAESIQDSLRWSQIRDDLLGK